MIDPDTNAEHISPIGMEHHTPRNESGGRYFADIKMGHFIIKVHQELFPELAEKMRENPNKATNVYGTFLALLPLQLRGNVNIELKRKILKSFKLIK